MTNGPGVLYLNQDLAVTEFLESTNTNGSCWTDTTGPHVYVKDNPGDNGGVPSNSGGLSFWESPDVFLVPRGDPPPDLNNGVSADWIVTANANYDIYVRVNNDGCNLNPIGGLSAAIFIANPDIGFTNWGSPISGSSSYGIGNTPSGNTTVTAYSRQMLGPFPWTAQGSGHQCVLVAIQADGETGPSLTQRPPAAYSSAQVAQRNLQFTANGCNYNISNNTGRDTYLQLGVSSTPKTTTQVPESITLTFTDTSSLAELSNWATTWNAQATQLQAGTTLAAAPRANGVLTVTLSGTVDLALDAVTLPAGDMPSISVGFAPQLGTAPTVAVSATLTDALGNIVSQNGGSCLYTPGVIVK